MSNITFNLSNFVNALIFHPEYAKAGKNRNKAWVATVAVGILTAGSVHLLIGTYHLGCYLYNKYTKKKDGNDLETQDNKAQQVFKSSVGKNNSSEQTQNDEIKEEPVPPKGVKLNQPGAEKPYSQFGKEAIEFARNKLKELSPKIENFKPHVFVKSLPSGVEEVVLQPANQEIAELYSLYRTYKCNIQKKLRYYQNQQLPAWKEQELIGIVNRYMKICYAISCLSLEDLSASTRGNGKQDRGTFAQALMNEDSYLLQTFTLIYNEFTSLHCGTFWRDEYHWSETSSIIGEFKKIPSYKEAFYQEGTDQNSWRLLSNDFCDYLSLYTSSSALFDAGSADSNSQSWRGHSQIYRHDDKDTLTLFSLKA